MSRKLSSTPAQDGFYMPAEFAKHEGIFMLWPQRTDNWRNGALPAQKVFSEVANIISKHQKMVVGVSDEQYQIARSMLNPAVDLIEVSANDSWARDNGPTKVINHKNQMRSVSWKFNAWGGLVDGLYFPWDKDDRVAEKVTNHLGRDYYQAPIVLEGGSIHSDGEGTIYTTEACLLSAGRNPHLSQSEIENYLKDYLGAKKVIWLKNGICEDETNEHIDNILQVVEPGHVLLHWTNNESDPQYKNSKSAYDLLEKATDAKGRKIKITKLVAPNPLIIVTKEEANGVNKIEGTLPRKAGNRMAASYINHLIINGAIIAPAFNLPTDEIAESILQSVYPTRKIYMVKNAREIILGGGNIHCITQQF